MPHISLPELPGITAGFSFRPETAKPMRELAHVLLNGPSSLTLGERELIAAWVSYLNGCRFCENSHSAVAIQHLNNPDIMKQIKSDFFSAPISDKLKALLTIASLVQVNGNYVTEADIEAARKENASDLEIHDTVLIAAAFCMFNRYVDGLGTFEPTDPNQYKVMAERLATHGYK